MLWCRYCPVLQSCSAVMGKRLLPAARQVLTITDLCSSAFCVNVDTTAGSSRPLAPRCREADKERMSSSCTWDCSQGQSSWGVCSLCHWYKLRSYYPGLALLVPFPSSLALGRRGSEGWDMGGRGQCRCWFWTQVLPQRWLCNHPLELLLWPVRIWEQKPWGLAALQPAAPGSEITVCCHSPRRDIDACLGWRSSREAGLLFHVCLSVCSEGVAGSAVSRHGTALQRASGWGLPGGVVRWTRAAEQGPRC